MPDLEGLVDMLWSGGSATWNLAMSLIRLLMICPPEQFSPDAWDLVKNTLYPWFLGGAAVMLNGFFFIGFIRQNINIRENFTIEILVESVIRVLIANVILINGLTIVNDFMTYATKATGFVMGTSGGITLSNPEFDLGTVLFYALFGIIYFIVSLVCAGIIVLEILKRFLFVYITIVGMPIGIATLPGGQGIANSGYAWMKTFLMYCGQIVVIALILRLGCVIGSSIPSFMAKVLESLPVIGLYDGMIGSFYNLIFMVFIASSVKGADSLIERLYGLR